MFPITDVMEMQIRKTQVARGPYLHSTLQMPNADAGLL
jgi:hypothetical protein